MAALVAAAPPEVHIPNCKAAGNRALSHCRAANANATATATPTPTAPGSERTLDFAGVVPPVKPSPNTIFVTHTRPSPPQRTPPSRPVHGKHEPAKPKGGNVGRPLRGPKDYAREFEEQRIRAETEAKRMKKAKEEQQALVSFRNGLKRMYEWWRRTIGKADVNANTAEFRDKAKAAKMKMEEARKKKEDEKKKEAEKKKKEDEKKKLECHKVVYEKDDGGKWRCVSRAEIEDEKKRDEEKRRIEASEEEERKKTEACLARANATLDNTRKQLEKEKADCVGRFKKGRQGKQRIRPEADMKRIDPRPIYPPGSRRLE